MGDVFLFFSPNYNTVLDRCPMITVLDRCWMFCCEAIMVEISLDAVLLSFFGFPALPSVRTLKNTHPPPPPRFDVVAFKRNVPLETAYFRVRNLLIGAKSEVWRLWGAQESKPTDRVLCCLHGIRDGIF